jgi:hypothetical protein
MNIFNPQRFNPKRNSVFYAQNLAVFWNLPDFCKIITKSAKKFKAFSDYIVADAYFSERPIVKAGEKIGN